VKNFLLIFSFLTFASIAFAAGEKILSIEIRCSKTNEYKSNGRYAGINYATDYTIIGTPLSFLVQKEDDKFRIFHQSYNLYPRDHRRAIIVTPLDSLDEVFLLPMSIDSKTSDWSSWQRPSYVETNAVSNFRFNYKPSDRSTNIPLNSFELRYKVE